MIIPDLPAGVVDTQASGFATYEGFRAAVLSWIDTDGADLNGDLIDNIIYLGEKRIEDDVRCREVESPLRATIAHGVAQIPFDYLELKNARVMYAGRPCKLERVDLAAFEHHHYGMLIARDGEDFVFSRPLGDGTVVTGTYYRKFIPLRNRPDSLLDPTSGSFQPLYAKSPALYLYAALEETEILIGRLPRAQLWKGKYAELLQRLEMKSQQERFSGSPMRIRPRGDRRILPIVTPFIPTAQTNTLELDGSAITIDS